MLLKCQINIITNKKDFYYQVPKTMFADFLCGSWILIALAPTLIAVAHTKIA